MFKRNKLIYLWLFVTIILLIIMINDFNDFLFAILLWLGVTIFLFSLYSDAQTKSKQFSNNKSNNPSKKELNDHHLRQEKIEHLQKLEGQNNQEIEALKQQCQQLKLELKQQSNLLKQDFQNDTLEILNSLLINYPTAKKMAEVKTDLPAKNLISLFTSLDNLVKNWGLETIGQPWEKVAFDSQFHQADSDDLKIGEDVYIRFVGYRNGEQILYPAKVSKNLPQGISK